MSEDLPSFQSTSPEDTARAVVNRAFDVAGADAKQPGHQLVALTVDLLRGYLVANPVAPGDLGDLLKSTHAHLMDLYFGAKQPASAPAIDDSPREPAVPIEESIHEDYIICLEDGRKLKTMRRHLMINYQLSPEQYRKRWGLPRDYPMVAPTHSRLRARLAKQNGLGKKRP